MSLSVVVSVFNGEKYLAACLTSIKDIASEIIVVDHESTDKTVEIAKKFTKKIYTQKNQPDDIDRQKNFGFEKANGDWILSLDADEQVTPELALEIRNLPIRLAQGEIGNTSVVGYYLPRRNIIFGKWIEHTGWYPDYQMRLFRKGKGKYLKKHVHEHVAIDGKTEKLTSSLIHENYQTIYQFLHRNLTTYALNEAENLQENGYVFSYADSLRFPIKEFLSRFFAREGYKDGFHGLILSILMAVYHFSVFLYLWEHEKFPDATDVQKILSSELKEAKKEWQFWQTSMDIERTKNPTTKVFFRAKRKLHL